MNLGVLETIARMSMRGESIIAKCNLMLQNGLLTRAEYVSLTSLSLQPTGMSPAGKQPVGFDGGSSPDQRWA